MATTSTDCIDFSTTLMIRNVPRKYTAQEVVNEVCRFVNQGDFDYVYVPWDMNGRSNMGLAFVNFRDCYIAANALVRLAYQEWTCVKYSRSIHVLKADVQGLPANLRCYRDNVVRRGGIVPAYAPFVFEGGLRVPLEDALERYCASAEGSEKFVAEVLTNEEFFEDDNSMLDNFDDGVGCRDCFCEDGARVGGGSLSTAGSAFGARTWTSPASFGTFPMHSDDLLPSMRISATPTLEELANLNQPHTYASGAMAMSKWTGFD